MIKMFSVEKERQKRKKLFFRSCEEPLKKCIHKIDLVLPLLLP